VPTRVGTKLCRYGSTVCASDYYGSGNQHRDVVQQLGIYFRYFTNNLSKLIPSVLVANIL